jgi:hypothetical protein
MIWYAAYDEDMNEEVFQKNYGMNSSSKNSILPAVIIGWIVRFDQYISRLPFIDEINVQ